MVLVVSKELDSHPAVLVVVEELDSHPVVLVVSEELDSHPAPEVEEHIDWDGDGQQQAVETQAAAASAALGEVVIHRGGEEQPTQRHDGDQHHQVGEGQHGSRYKQSTVQAYLKVSMSIQPETTITTVLYIHTHTHSTAFKLLKLKKMSLS